MKEIKAENIITGAADHQAAGYLKKIRGMRCTSALILLLTLILCMVSGCASQKESYPDAEAQVASELDAVKSGREALSGSEDLISVYSDKLRDFDYAILGSSIADGDEETGTAVTVRVRIKTYDFGTVYLKTWNEYMALDESDRSEEKFNSDLQSGIKALTDKNCINDVDIICSPLADSGGMQTDIRSNEALMNALSGGMLEQMNELAEQ